MDWSRVSTGLVPLTDLGTGQYQGQPGGLYPGGSNLRSLAHESAGVTLAQSVQPRDANGSPDANGKYVLVSVGMSNTSDEFERFKSIADADPAKAPQLVIVNGAQGSKAVEDWMLPDSPTWRVLDQRLQQAGVTPAQVSVAWVKQAAIRPTGDFLAEARELQQNLSAVARNLHGRYPNLKLVYFSSRIYGGYSTMVIRSEPHSYGGGFAVKWLIEAQINGAPELNFDPDRGAVTAPWLSWGPYLWADGLGLDGALGGTPGRRDGLEWDCRDLVSDGVHPSAQGRVKVAQLLLDFLKTDVTARSWFLH